MIFIKAFFKSHQAKKIKYRNILERLTTTTKRPASSIKLVFKFPTGNRHEHTFRKSDTLSLLFMFVFSNEDCPQNFEIATNFPRKVVQCDETTVMSIEEFGITQSTILFVIDTDA